MRFAFAYSQLEVNVLAGQKGFELSIRDNDPTKRSSVLNTNQSKYVFLKISSNNAQRSVSLPHTSLTNMVFFSTRRIFPAVIIRPNKRDKSLRSKDNEESVQRSLKRRVFAFRREMSQTKKEIDDLSHAKPEELWDLSPLCRQARHGQTPSDSRVVFFTSSITA